ncbi:MAG: aromatic ring-hydroxylating dioxygenase subunit alpha [Bacteriovoracaceae bacterium]|nr:aromatic ring-hydroxylating dioxygenase subunit alpha [Bacteriovoracaceae bacterium]
MSALSDVKIFGQRDTVVEGWYWAFKSRDLKKGETRPLNFLGKELAVYRGQDSKVYAVDAYCPHMGAHLAEGKVEGKGLRCFFHHWKFDESGELVDIPCRKTPGISVSIKHYAVEEKYQTIWIYTGDTPRYGVHSIEELDGIELDSSFGNQFVKECHPNIMMINAIDAHHFASVHDLPVDVKFETRKISEHTIQFNNITKIPVEKWYLRFIGRFYANALTYSMSYTAGSTGSVTVGPDFLHCHIIFALRPTGEGRAEGLTILVTKKRKGLKGLLLNPIILFATKCVGNYFAKGDTEVFKSIRFNFSNPIKEDEAVIKFIQHLEKQNCVEWGFGKVRVNH